MPRLEVRQIEGLQLSVDRKAIESASVLSGRNFIVDTEGPNSIFSFEGMEAIAGGDEYIQSFRIGTDLIYFYQNPTKGLAGIKYLNWPKQKWEPRFDFIFNPAYEGYSVFKAYVGGKYYFAHIGWGVYEYDPITGSWYNVTGSFPSETFAITQSGGRAIALSRGLVSWSAIDIATDFVPSTTTGAGAQSLSLVGIPESDTGYIGVYDVSDGFVTFLDTGIIQSIIIDSIIPFRHKNLDQKVTPLNTWCVVALTKSQLVFLAKTGLYRYTGQGFEQWQVTFNEYLKKKEITPSLQKNSVGFIQLSFSEDREWFFISRSNSLTGKVFEYAYALYIPVNKWGMFNHLHTNFIEIDRYATQENVEFGFVSEFFAPRIFTANTSNYITEFVDPEIEEGLVAHDEQYVQENFDYETLILEDVHYMNTVGEASSAEVFKQAYLAFGSPQAVGYYGTHRLYETKLDEDQEDEFTFSSEVSDVNYVNSRGYTKQGLKVYLFSQYPKVQYSLNSKIVVGLFRLTDDQAHDQLSFITNVSVSMENSAEANLDVEDWLNDYPVDVYDDWLSDYAIDIFEDWGFGLSSRSSYTTLIRGSNDGYNVFEDQERELDLFRVDGKTSFYSTNVQGIYVWLELIAENLDESIILKHLEFTGTLAGRV
jgi:hypothetical protein